MTSSVTIVSRKARSSSWNAWSSWDSATREKSISRSPLAHRDTFELFCKVGPMTPFADRVNELKAGSASARESAESLIRLMTDDELLWLLDGDVPARAMLRLPALIKAGPVAGGAVSRLGIPGIRFSDGPRGVVIGHSTAFPVTIMRAATW